MAQRPFSIQVAADAQKVLAGAATDAVFNAKSPGDTAVALATPTANEQYSIEGVQMSISAACSVTLKNEAGAGASKILWGPHALPAAGIYNWVFPRGLKVGAGKVPLVTTTAGNGTIDLSAVRVAAR
jgi:hypothetical protein